MMYDIILKGKLVAHCSNLNAARVVVLNTNAVVIPRNAYFNPLRVVRRLC